MDARLTSRNSEPVCNEVMALAEHELSAFLHAIKQMFGPEQAKLSAESWLRQLIESDGLPASANEWRSITIKAATSLASFSIELTTV